MFSTINIELNNVYKWCNANKLTIHPDKTKYMVFHPSRRKPELDNLNVTIHGHDVERVQQTKFLGITLHQNLSWTAHINAINSKVSKTLGILYKARQYLEISTLRLLYNSLILPYLQYCTIVLLYGHQLTRLI